MSTRNKLDADAKRVFDRNVRRGRSKNEALDAAVQSIRSRGRAPQGVRRENSSVTRTINPPDDAPPATLDYSTFGSTNGGVVQVRREGVSNPDDLLAGIIEPENDLDSRFPGPSGSFRKQFRTYVDVYTSADVNAPSQYNSGNFTINPWPYVTYQEVDYTTSGANNLHDAAGWAEVAPDTLCIRMMSASVLCSPVGNLVDRGGVVNVCYYPFDVNGNTTDFSTGSQFQAGGSFPYAQGVESYATGVSFPLSLGWYGFWTPFDLSWFDTWQAVNGDPTSGGSQRTQAGWACSFDTSGFTSSTLIFRVAIIANFECIPIDAARDMSIDDIFVTRSDWEIAYTMAKYYPKIVENLNHKDFIRGAKRALGAGKSVMDFYKRHKEVINGLLEKAVATGAALL